MSKQTKKTPSGVAGVAFWSLAGLISLGYIGWLGVKHQPSLLAGADFSQFTVSANSAPADPQNLHGEMTALRSEIGELQRIKQRLAQQLSAMEHSPGPYTSALPPRARPAPEEPRAIKRPSGPIAAMAFGAEETIGTLPAKPGRPAAQREISPVYAIHLASADRKALLRRKWFQLVKREKFLFQGLSPHYQRKVVNGRESYALLAGPLLDVNDVNRVCSRLIAKGMKCRLESMKNSETGDAAWADASF